jgi:hypothetical protein
MAHSMVKNGSRRWKDFGFQLDWVCSITMPTLYVVVTFLLILFGSLGPRNRGAGSACLVIGGIAIFALFFVTIVWTKQRVTGKELRRDKALVDLKAVDVADESQFRACANEAFHAFDKDTVRMRAAAQATKP